MPKDIRIDLSLENEDPAATETVLGEAGARDIEKVSEKGFTGVEILFFATMALPALTNLVIRLSPLLKSGVVVDARGSRVRIRKDNSLPRGDVLVLTKKGEKSTLHAPSEAKLSPLLRQEKDSLGRE